MIVSFSVKSMLFCNKADNMGRFGGKTISRRSFMKRYGRRGNQTYALSVTALSDEKLN